MQITTDRDLSTKIRQQILRAAYESKHGHIPTCFSVVEILQAVYDNMVYDPNRPDWEGRDYFILSKGHAALALYATLATYGFFPTHTLSKFGQYQSPLGCHADRHKVPGVEWGTGSLGHGITAAIGIAMALKQQNKKNQVYVLIGDGESNEGSVWEGLLIAAHQKLNNLTIILDNNRSQERCLPLQNPVDKFKAFGLQTSEVNGHNLDELAKSLLASGKTAKMIVANTIKGYGCPTLVDEVYAWHRRSPNEEELRILQGELDA